MGYLPPVLERLDQGFTSRSKAPPGTGASVSLGSQRPHLGAGTPSAAAGDRESPHVESCSEALENEIRAVEVASVVKRRIHQFTWTS